MHILLLGWQISAFSLVLKSVIAGSVVYLIISSKFVNCVFLSAGYV